jgi:predicted LPLAT superfamily acyltransferase
MRRPIDHDLNHRPAWIAQPERSNTLAMRGIVWAALTLGRAPTRLLLYPICLYFLLFSFQSRTASRKYLRKVLERPPRLSDLFRHYHAFAATVLDRVFLLNGRFADFDVHMYGKTMVDDIIARGEGCFLLGAHLGSFEIVRALGRNAKVPPMNLVMYEENARKLNSVLDAINPDLPVQVIALGKVDSMLKVEAALARGELVGMLGDRTIAGEGTVQREFLGEQATLPLGPLRIAIMLKRPIVLMFGLYRGGKRYDIHFEVLADMRQLERSEREGALDHALNAYLARIEHYCRLYPYNWFNFYDFWR